MRLAGVVAILVLAAGGALAAETSRVAGELWDRPRSGAAVMGDPAVRQAVDRLVSDPSARVVIHHVRQQEALLQAEELRSWLVALAVDARRIALMPDGSPGSGLRLEISK